MTRRISAVAFRDEYSLSPREFRKQADAGGVGPARLADRPRLAEGSDKALRRVFAQP